MAAGIANCGRAGHCSFRATVPVWVGHSCPTNAGYPAQANCSLVTDSTERFSVQVKVQGVGQECPTDTGSATFGDLFPLFTFLILTSRGSFSLLSGARARGRSLQDCGTQSRSFPCPCYQ